MPSLLPMRLFWQAVAAAFVVIGVAGGAVMLSVGGVPLLLQAAGPAAVATVLSAFAIGLLARQVNIALARNTEKMRLHFEHELARKTAELRSTLENMHQGVAMYDADYKLLTWNQKFREFLHMPDGSFGLHRRFLVHLRCVSTRRELG